MRLAILMLLPLAACARPSHAECTSVIDRYVDMRAGEAPELLLVPEATRAAVRDAQAASKRREPVYFARIEQCQREVSRSALACGMAAPGPNEWEACFR